MFSILQTPQYKVCLIFESKRSDLNPFITK